MAMVVDGVDLAELFSANPSVFVLRKLKICAGAAFKKLQCLGSGNRNFRALNVEVSDANGLSGIVGCFLGWFMSLLSGFC